LNKILLDLDVLTVAFWKGDKKEIALKFLNRIKNQELILITPYSLIELVNLWNDKILSNKINDFYVLYSSKIISKIEVAELLSKNRIDEKKIIYNLESLGIKDEDSVLVLICSIFNMEYLVTFNRKHLKNNKDKINGVLNKYGLKTIKIVEPNEV